MGMVAPQLVLLKQVTSAQGVHPFAQSYVETDLFSETRFVTMLTTQLEMDVLPHAKCRMDGLVLHLDSLVIRSAGTGWSWALKLVMTAIQSMGMDVVLLAE